MRQVGHAFQRGRDAFDELSREAGRGQQTGGVLETPQGERLVGLGQDIPQEGRQPDPESPRLGGSPPPQIPSRSPGEVVRETGFQEQAEEEEFFQPPEEAGGGAIEELQEEPLRVGSAAQEEELQGSLFEEAPGQGVEGQELRENYQVYQALRPDLDELAGRAGGRRTPGRAEFIPFTITNVSDRTAKKLEPGQTVQLKGVLNTGEIRYELAQPGETPGTFRSVKIGKRELDKQVRNGTLKISRKTD